ncbi:MAG: FAD-binding oxidoreductase, partial [Deltaproteobacteria bacterium]|nr:FAD-binding oxidoreductase [Deltaproteobacteria bacterium]
MSSNIIPLKKVLSKFEYQMIDDFGRAHQGKENLPQIADFLLDTFSLPLILDQEIIAGYASDSSNLPAQAEALCRPDNKQQAAIILRLGRAAKIPITLSAGRSNLTGSATAETGILLSTANLNEPEVDIDQKNL